jgi:hypothetical protein
MTTELALIDSGAGGNFIDEETVTKLQLARTELRRPIVVRNVDGSRNNNRLITHRVYIDATIAGRKQPLGLLITRIGKQNIILGLPWLNKENPDIDWHAGTLQWRPNNFGVVGNNNFKEGGDFPSSHPFTHPLAPYFKSDDSFPLSLAETFEEPDTPLDISCLGIFKIKISDHFNQLYGSKDKKTEPKDVIPKFYHKFLHLFDKKASERFPKPRPYDHEIHLKPDFKPVRQAPYSLNPMQMDLAKKFVQENLDKGYIVPSKSDMASPLFFVGKKDGTYRPCQDYRKLNEGTIKDAFPLPNINALLGDLTEEQVFTLIDVRRGYNNIEIIPRDRDKAAFSTPFGLYAPTVMFFGLCNSLATFQRMMNHILWTQINEGWCKVYMDDILISAKDLPTLRARTLQVLQVLEDNDLYLNTEKCEFEKRKIAYLGFVIEPGKISMDPKKLAGISDWPQPKNLCQVRSFLGFGNFYRRFIQ